MHRPFVPVTPPQSFFHKSLRLLRLGENLFERAGLQALDNHGAALKPLSLRFAEPLEVHLASSGGDVNTFFLVILDAHAVDHVADTHAVQFGEPLALGVIHDIAGVVVQRRSWGG